MWARGGNARIEALRWLKSTMLPVITGSSRVLLWG